MKKMWISVMCKNGVETVLGADEICGMRFDSDQILILLAGGNKLLFGIEQDIDGFGVEVVTREELEKLRVNLQTITEEEK